MMTRTVWTEAKIKNGIYKAIEELAIDRMPTSAELRANRMSGLGKAIGDAGGFYEWAEKLGLKRKERESIWGEKRIKFEILKCVNVLGINRMPTASEITSIGRNDLHCAISKSESKYSGWADKLNLELKDSETNLGQKFEKEVMELVGGLGHAVIRMSTKHPYDLLVENSVKVDVKVANPYLLRGESRVHTIRLAEVNPTCDIYICVLLDEERIAERVLVIPSHHVRKTMLNIGRKSKYNVYDGRFDYIEEYAEFFKKIS